MQGLILACKADLNAVSNVQANLTYVLIVEILAYIFSYI